MIALLVGVLCLQVAGESPLDATDIWIVKGSVWKNFDGEWVRNDRPLVVTDTKALVIYVEQGPVAGSNGAWSVTRLVGRDTRQDVEDLLDEGRARIREGKNAEALEIVSKVIELDPKNAVAYGNRGTARFGLKDFKGALEDYTRAIDLGSSDAVLYRGRARAELKLSKFGEAARDLTRAIEIDPENPVGYRLRASARRGEGKLDQALEDVDRALASDPRDYRALVERGHIYLAKGDTEDAMFDFVSARIVGRHHATRAASLGLARGYEKMGKLEEALMTWEGLLREAPDDTEAEQKVRDLKKQLGK